MFQSPLVEELLRPLRLDPDPSGQIAAIFRAMVDAEADLRLALQELDAALPSDEQVRRACARRSRAVNDMIISLQAANYALQRSMCEADALQVTPTPDSLLKGNGMNEMNPNRSQHA